MCFSINLSSWFCRQNVERRNWSKVTWKNSDCSCFLEWLHNENLNLFWVRYQHNNCRVFHNVCSQNCVLAGLYVCLTVCKGSKWKLPVTTLKHEDTRSYRDKWTHDRYCHCSYCWTKSVYLTENTVFFNRYPNRSNYVLFFVVKNLTNFTFDMNYCRLLMIFNN